MKKFLSLIICIAVVMLSIPVVYAESIPRENTPDYKVAFYMFPSYHVQDEYGNKSGYGYELMEKIEKHSQCTFSYVGYDISPKDCEEMLKNGELDIYTAAKKTAEREEYFAFSKYPCITAYTCMNIKRGNSKIIPGNYSSYNGATVGLMDNHTYNNAFLEYAEEKGFTCDIKYYNSSTELKNALIKAEVDIIVDSYIRTREDEISLESFGETPYYFMVRKEDKAVLDMIDSAIDYMNLTTPTWRSDLFNKYYGAQSIYYELTENEKAYLTGLQAEGTKIRGLMGADRKPYSWFENGQPKGINADLFILTAEELGLDYEIVPAESLSDFESNTDIDIVLDILGDFERTDDNNFKITENYLTASLSILRLSDSSGKISKVGTIRDNYEMNKTIETTWPSAEISVFETTDEGKEALLDNRVDAIIMRSFRAEQAAHDDSRGRFRVDVVSNSVIPIRMGVNSSLEYEFFEIWEKTLMKVSSEYSTEITQKYLESAFNTNLIFFLYQHPAVFISMITVFIILTFVMIMLRINVRRRKQQQIISDKLTLTLEELRSSNEQIEAQVEELEKAKSLAESANRAKSAFLFSMSHDIRTPMNAIIGFRNLLEKNQDDPEKRKDYLKKIEDSSTILLSIINNVLEMARIETGAIELEESVWTAEQFNDTIYSIFEGMMRQKNITFTRTIDVTHPYVYSDAPKLREVFANILSNAYKYTLSGGHVNMDLKELPGETEDTVLYRTTISDSGIGMSEEFLPHIFEEFTRENNTTDTKIEGTGLGMPIVKRLVDMLNGTIEVTSQKNRGTTFVVTIPHRIAEKPKFVPDMNVEYDRMCFEGKRILLAEDNDLNAEIAIEILSGEGFEVEHASDGAKCVDMLKNAPDDYYDIILMDIQMPNMNGYEATKTIRALSDAKKSAIPIIAMTANAFEEDKREAFRAGMNYHLAKPIKVDELMTTLAEVLNKSNIQ
ncbi:MAG: transporter substrate-binding domain-containing protein [Clostridia bacterium]|nr:transporter substrate-binding domain-containing protein [Clostridia bacterium]